MSLQCVTKENYFIAIFVGQGLILLCDNETDKKAYNREMSQRYYECMFSIIWFPDFRFIRLVSSFGGFLFCFVLLWFF